MAVEPSASLRVGLMTRFVADADLRERVTLLPDAWSRPCRHPSPGCWP
jgi:hypothetical protein